MATADDPKTGVLAQVALMVALFAEEWLREKFLFLTVLLSLAAMVQALSVGTVPWALAAVLAIVGAATALFGPLLRPWRPSSTWLTMVTTVSFDLGVIFVLSVR